MTIDMLSDDVLLLVEENGGTPCLGRYVVSIYNLTARPGSL